MQATEMECTGTHSKIVSPKQHRRATYSNVMDQRKRPIRGLWERIGRYYAQLAIENQVTGIKRVKRVPNRRNPFQMAFRFGEANRLRPA
jgi:hypothetical protein